MENNFLAMLYAREMENEYRSTRRCLEKIPQSLYSFKPHPTSMELGYLTQLVAEIPQWIAETLKEGVIDFATYKHFKLSTTEDLLSQFEDSFKKAVKALQEISDSELEEKFVLQTNGKVVMSTTKKESIGSTINHWVHHRGQLTVYMRMNGIPVPSIYGPSADDTNF